MTVAMFQELRLLFTSMPYYVGSSFIYVILPMKGLKLYKLAVAQNDLPAPHPLPPAVATGFCIVSKQPLKLLVLVDRT